LFYAEEFKTLTLTLSQKGRGEKKKLGLLPFSSLGRRGWGMRVSKLPHNISNYYN